MIYTYHANRLGDLMIQMPLRVTPYAESPLKIYAWIENNHTIARILENKPGLVFTNILILRIYLFLEFSKNFVESWEIF